MSADDRLQQMLERLGLSGMDGGPEALIRRAQPPRPSYRLDQSDVDFLRSLGIDPSRTGRSKS
jgi:hypothetical protein